MMGANAQITTFRLIKTGNKEAFSTEATLGGTPVHISRPSLERASIVDQSNALEIFRMDSDTILDLKKGDKAVDEYETVYIVHSVYHERGNMDAGNGTYAFLRRKND